MEIRHGEVALEDVTLHYARCGEGELVIFLHGFPQFWYQWRHQLPVFGAARLAVAPDMRGYNLSSRPPAISSYVPERLAADVAGLVRHFSTERCAVVGHDWGGFVAAMFAHFYPQMVERLVLINAPNPTQWMTGFMSLPAQIEASQYIRLFRSPEAEQLLSAGGWESFCDTAFVDAQGRPLLSEEERPRYIEAWSRAGGLTGGLNYYRALPVEPPEAAAAPAGPPPADIPVFTVRAPTRVIWGDRDAFLMAECLDLCPEVFADDLEIRFVQGASHWVAQERMETVNDLIAEFLR
jgi:pimeloyl-ACP methyl ester carboxylesterase